ncbi:Crp/Fnr family transcriptional regulator [Pararhodonellum marinum]|uniref:Crp/Fnr family transcriptional regulator n=1 Tax=Pararhodonellum marinum TaxID=2755358 RepID=UPI0018900DC9|nr:Crp/Fnr family transcriptional regulator [Pararhodonellum marinum]
MESLHNYLNRYISTPISKEEFEVIKSHFTPKKIKKRQFFLVEGEISKHFAFILKGAMRKYYVDDKGKEHTTNLFVENWWVSDRESFVMSTPSIYNIDAWEDCEILLISKESLAKLLNKSQAFNEMILKLDERNNIATQKRITSTISATAKVRYDDFVTSYPEFLQRFPQHLIASYLGITKDTLSRIRKQTVHK